MKKYILVLSLSIAGFASSARAQGVDVDAYNRLVRMQIQALEDQELDALTARLKASNDRFTTPQPTEYELCAREALRAGWQPQAYGCVYVPARIW
jgi:hypothetical protein